MTQTRLISTDMFSTQDYHQHVDARVFPADEDTRGVLSLRSETGKTILVCPVEEILMFAAFAMKKGGTTLDEAMEHCHLVMSIVNNMESA